jgi:hypothetical protein
MNFEGPAATRGGLLFRVDSPVMGFNGGSDSVRNSR